MTSDEPVDQTRFTLRDGFDLTGASQEELWWRYLAIGGTATLATLTERMDGVAACDDTEHVLIAHAINEWFLERGLGTFPVSYRPAPERVTAAQDAGRNQQDEAAEPARLQPAEVRQWAAQARMRSATAARQAAALHLAASRLMQSSGRQQLARNAWQRADRAQSRGDFPGSIPD